MKTYNQEGLIFNKNHWVFVHDTYGEAEVRSSHGRGAFAETSGHCAEFLRQHNIPVATGRNAL